MNISDLSASQLSQAAAIKAQIEKLQTDLATVLGTPAAAVSPTVPTVTATPVKRVVSAATRAKMAAAQQRRWVVKQPATPAKPTPPKKFTMSASAKAAISKAAKARWAKIRAAQKK